MEANVQTYIRQVLLPVVLPGPETFSSNYMFTHLTCFPHNIFRPFLLLSYENNAFGSRNVVTWCLGDLSTKSWNIYNLFGTFCLIQLPVAIAQKANIIFQEESGNSDGNSSSKICCIKYALMLKNLSKISLVRWTGFWIDSRIFLYVTMAFFIVSGSDRCDSKVSI